MNDAAVSAADVLGAGALVLVLLAAIGAGHTFGLGDRWNALPLVHRQPWLR